MSAPPSIRSCRSAWLIKDTFRSDLRIAKVSAPVLVLHGERDRVVPLRFGEPFRAGQRAQTHGALSQGGHVDLDDHGAVMW